LAAAAVLVDLAAAVAVADLAAAASVDLAVADLMAEVLVGLGRIKKGD
jgi:hypothetical protein